MLWEKWPKIMLVLSYSRYAQSKLSACSHVSSWVIQLPMQNALHSKHSNGQKDVVSLRLVVPSSKVYLHQMPLSLKWLVKLNGKTYHPNQCNNSMRQMYFSVELWLVFIFPGLGLGATVCRPSRVRAESSYSAFWYLRRLLQRWWLLLLKSLHLLWATKN